jgi:hypothetical protein
MNFRPRVHQRAEEVDPILARPWHLVLVRVTLSNPPAYLVTRLSDCNDNKSTMVLQTVLVMHMLSSLVATYSDC